MFQKLQARGFVLCSEGHSLNSLVKSPRDKLSLLLLFFFFLFWVCLYVDLSLAKQISYDFVLKGIFYQDTERIFLVSLVLIVC